MLIYLFKKKKEKTRLCTEKLFILSVVRQQRQPSNGNRIPTPALPNLPSAGYQLLQDHFQKMVGVGSHLARILIVLIQKGIRSHRQTVRDWSGGHEERGRRINRPDSSEGARQSGPDRPRIPSIGRHRRLFGGMRGQYRPGVAREAPAAVLRRGVCAQEKLQG